MSMKLMFMCAYVSSMDTKVNLSESCGSTETLWEILLIFMGHSFSSNFTEELLNESAVGW